MTLGLDHDPETDDCMPRACQKVYSRSMQQTFFCLLRADVLHSCGTTNTAYMEFERVLVASVPRHSKVSPFVHNPPAFGEEIGAEVSRLGGVWQRMCEAELDSLCIKPRPFAGPVPKRRPKPVRRGIGLGELSAD